MADDFIGRTAELRALEEAWDRPGPQLIVLWGRRRTGKTRLLGRFFEGRRSVFYGATEQSAAEELKGLSRAVREALPRMRSDLLTAVDFPGWDSALSYLAEQAREGPLAVALDEFPYLVASDPALPSILQRFWDHGVAGTQLKLILCGSAQAVMDELQHERAPLFGRIDVRLQLKPFGHREAALFLPDLPSTERAVAYGVLGGMPQYLKRWGADGPRANLRRLFGDPASPLVEEGEFVLKSELSEGSGYYRILHGISGGDRTYGKIKAFADIDIERQLDRLIRLGLVEREVPVTENPDRSKRAVYRVADNFLAFWFRFVYRNRGNIARGLGREVVDRGIMPGLSDHMGEAWEAICRDHLRHLAANQSLPAAVSDLGRWWNTDHSVEIDAVGLDRRRVTLVGSVKWSRRAGPAELARLQRSVGALPDPPSAPVYVLAAREEIHDVDTKAVVSLTAADVFGV